MPDPLQQVEQLAIEHNLFDGLAGSTLVLAVSGGADSLTLLHTMLKIAPQYGFGLHVAHLDHGIRGAQSAADAEFVALTAAEWGVPFTGALYDVPEYARQHGYSLEDAARRVRYRFLGAVAGRVAASGVRPVVATGHNADDQVETLLLRLLRGAGLRGLAAMRPASRLPVGRVGEAAADLPWPPVQGALLRPLLATWRGDIDSYCVQHGIQPRTDATNSDSHYTRNRIRHELVPLLEDMKPGFRARAWNTTELLGDEDAALDGLLDSQLKGQPPPASQSIDLQPVAVLPLALRRRLLLRTASNLPASCGALLQRLNAGHIRAALRLMGTETPEGAQTSWPCDITLAKKGAMLVFSGPGLVKSTPGAPIYLLNEPGNHYALTVPGDTELGAWYLRSTVINDDTVVAGFAARFPHNEGAVFDADVLDVLSGARPLVVRARRAGERFRPFGLAGRHRKLQDVFLDAHIPSEVRARYSLLGLPGADGEVLWVPGVRRSQLAPIMSDTKRILIVEAIIR